MGVILADEILLFFYQFARNKADDIARIRWDLVVIDEAHRLRNVYKKANVIARTLRDALNHAPKLLLTATPLQNSLLELFGRVSFVDDGIDGEVEFKDDDGRASGRKIYVQLKSGNSYLRTRRGDGCEVFDVKDDRHLN